MAEQGPLAGIRVIELGTGVAGPYGGKLLADYGAEVIKVEPVDGDQNRQVGQWFDQHESEEFTYLYLVYNTGKKSIGVDLSTDEGREIFWSLLEGADVVHENMRSGVMERLGLGWDDIQERNSRVIYCSVTGYGEYGPYTDWPAWDPTVQAVSGWTDLIGESDEPVLMDVPAIDHITALSAVIGILMALIERGVSGNGQKVNVSMLDAAVSFLNHQFGEYSAAQNQDEVETSYRRIMQPLGAYETSDGYIGLIVFEEEWETFCETIGKSEFADDDHKFATNEKRIEHSQDLSAALDEVFKTKTTSEWLSHLREYAPNVPASPLNEMDDIWGDEHLLARNQILTHTHPELGDYKLTRPPQRFSRSTFSIENAPTVGQHTDELLEREGYTQGDIDELRRNDFVK